MTTKAKYKEMTGYIDGYIGGAVAMAIFISDGKIHLAPVGKVEIIETQPKQEKTKCHSAKPKTSP